MTVYFSFVLGAVESGVDEAGTGGAGELEGEGEVEDTSATTFAASFLLMGHSESLIRH